MRRFACLLLLLALALPAWAQTTTTTTTVTTTSTIIYEGSERYSDGTLVNAQAANGDSAFLVGVRRPGVLRFEVLVTGTVTVTLQNRIADGTLRDLATPAPLVNASGFMDVANPAGGDYRIKVTNCSGCSVTVKYAFLPSG